MLTWFVYPASATAVTNNAIDVDTSLTERNIGLDLLIFEDATTQLDIEQIQSEAISSQFKPSTKSNNNFGYTSSAYWAKFTLNDLRTPLQDNARETLYLNLSYAQTDFASLWCSNSEGEKVLQQQAGDHIPRADWPTNYREPTFKLPPTAHTCWLRVQSTASMQFPLTLYSQEAFFNMRLQDNAVQALYFGALLVMMFYNGLLALSTRSGAYASYTFFLSAYALFQCAFGGVGYALLWTDGIGIADNLLPFFILAQGAGSIIFATQLLDMRTVAHRWYQYGVTVAILCAACMLGALFLPYSIALRSVFILLPLWVVAMLGCGIHLALRGVRVAQIYLCAWTMFIGGTIVLMLSRFGVLPLNGFTSNATQIGSAIEFVLLSFALSDRIKILQNNLLDAQKSITDSLRNSELTLEQKVRQRTAELLQSNQQLQQEKAKAEASQARVEQTLNELKTTQAQLIAAEKMASLGLLVSNVAHEINTPIGAVKSSGALIADTLDSTLADMPRLLTLLDPDRRELFIKLITRNNAADQPLSMREERVLAKAVTSQLEELGVDDAKRKAKLLIKLRAHDQALDYLPLLNHHEDQFILNGASNIANIVSGTQNINAAVDKVSRIVYALKTLSGSDVLRAPIVAPLYIAMDKALDKFNNQMHNVQLNKIYQNDTPPIHADHDAIEQLCVHLVMNALQAMNYVGNLSLEISTDNNQACISVSDTGTGIAEDIQSRIFEPFFTTRTSGEGSGMGLAIVKRIIDQHQGRIEIISQLSKGTTFKVLLPYTTQATEVL